MKIKIEKNIPIPSKGDSKYPFKEMKKGDSFLGPNTPSFRTTGYISARKLKFKIRFKKEGDMVRVWRIT